MANNINVPDNDEQIIYQIGANVRREGSEQISQFRIHLVHANHNFEIRFYNATTATLAGRLVIGPGFRHASFPANGLFYSMLVYPLPNGQTQVLYLHFELEDHYHYMEDFIESALGSIVRNEREETTEAMATKASLERFGKKPIEITTAAGRDRNAMLAGWIITPRQNDLRNKLSYAYPTINLIYANEWNAFFNQRRTLTPRVHFRDHPLMPRIPLFRICEKAQYRLDDPAWQQAVVQEDEEPYDIADEILVELYGNHMDNTY